MKASKDDSAVPAAPQLKLTMLDLEQVIRIDEMLASMGEFGEVHLIVQHRELRCINRMESEKAGRRNGSSPRG